MDILPTNLPASSAIKYANCVETLWLLALGKFENDYLLVGVRWSESNWVDGRGWNWKNGGLSHFRELKFYWDILIALGGNNRVLFVIKNVLIDLILVGLEYKFVKLLKYCPFSSERDWIP